MIVIVETNFLLELVLQQEQSGACEELLAICAGSGNAQLVIPAFAVAEAGMVLERRRGERRKFVEEGVSRQVSDIRRSQVLVRYRILLNELRDELLLANQDESARWDELQVSIGDHVAPMTADALIGTIATRIGLDMAMPDALVLTSVRHYLEETRKLTDVPAVFVSRDKKEFGTPEVATYLRGVDCTFINSFENAVHHVRNASR